MSLASTLHEEKRRLYLSSGLSYVFEILLNLVHEYSLFRDGFRAFRRDLCVRVPQSQEGGCTPLKPTLARALGSTRFLQGAR